MEASRAAATAEALGLEVPRCVDYRRLLASAEADGAPVSFPLYPELED